MMFQGGPTIKTRAEQTLDWLEAQRLVRRLTDAEWADLSRCEHVIYEHKRRRAVTA